MKKKILIIEAFILGLIIIFSYFKIAFLLRLLKYSDKYSKLNFSVTFHMFFKAARN